MKHIGRSLLALMLAIFLAAGLYGCGGTNGPDGPKQENPGAEEPVIPPQVPVRVFAVRQADGAILTDLRYTYDQYGNKMAEINYQFGLLPKGYYTYEYTYGPGGIPVKRTTYLQSQDLSQMTAVETFDTDGRLTGRQEYNNDGKRTFEYAYDERGNETLYLSCDETGRMVSKQETAYDKNGQRVSERYTESDGSVTYREYQGELCSRRVETDANGSEIIYTYAIQHDTRGNLLTYSAVSDKTGALNFRRDYQNTYDSKGRLTGVEVTDQNGVCLEKTYYRYDREGRLIQTDSSEFAENHESRQVWDTLYAESGILLQRDHFEQWTTDGVTEEASSCYLYDQQGLLTDFTYRKNGSSLHFIIGRISGQPVVLEKVCDGPLLFSDFDLVFTGENDFTMDGTPYTAGDAAFSGSGSYTRIYTYKEDGRLSAIEETAPDGIVTKQWTYTYQRPHNAPEQTVAAIPYNGGASSISIYSDNNTLLSTASFVRNDAGLYDQMTTWEGSFHFVYGLDEDGLTTGVRYDANGKARGSMTYDSHGNMIREMLYGDPHAIELAYTYDAVGKQITSYPWSSSATAYCAYTYDETGGCTSMMLYDGEERLPEQLLPEQLLERYTYSYDREGRIKRMECRNIRGSMEGYILYQYGESETP